MTTSWRRTGFTLIAMLSLILAGGLGAGSASEVEEQPYAGWQERSIRALAPEEVQGYLEGQGMGYALTAELNHYPGPLHALDLAEQLGMTKEQERRVSAIRAEMQEAARDLGQRIIELEEHLESAFRSGEIRADDVERLTGEIASVQGQLRAVHLIAHLQTKAVLTPHQVTRYDELRGYTADHVGNGDHNPGQHQHQNQQHGH